MDPLDAHRGSNALIKPNSGNRPSKRKKVAKEDSHSDDESDIAVAPEDSVSDISSCRSSAANSAKSFGNRKADIIWKFFKKPYFKKRNQVQVKMKLNSLLCTASFKPSPNSTSNLRKHVEKVHKPLYDQCLADTNFIPTPAHHGSVVNHFKIVHKAPEYSDEGFEEEMALLIAVDDQPVTFIESNHVRHVLKMLKPDIKLVSADTMRTCVLQMYEKYKIKFISLLATISRVSLTLDIWTSPSSKPFLGITVHSIDND
jgi:hypothetical protein